MTFGAKAFGRGPGGDIVGQAHHFQRPRAVVAALEEPALLEGGNEPVDAGFRAQLQRLLHLLEAGREAGAAQMPVDEGQQFVLFTREHARLSGGWRCGDGTNRQPRRCSR
jgi:hypothetical protein